jgi:hypothetical protein
LIINKTIEKWDKLKSEEGYNKLLESGMFFEIFPELTGGYKEDWKLIHDTEIVDSGIN